MAKFYIVKKNETAFGVESKKYAHNTDKAVVVDNGSGRFGHWTKQGDWEKTAYQHRDGVVSVVQSGSGYYVSEKSGHDWENNGHDYCFYETIEEFADEYGDDVAASVAENSGFVGAKKSAALLKSI